jgi:hypothetical protein
VDDADVRSNRAAADWGGSGLAYLTGLPGGPPDFSRSAVLAEARRVADQIRRRSGVELDAAAILAGRAAMLGLTRGGDVSAGGATRLLRTRNGLCALTLSRPDDVDALPAMLEVDALPEDPWRALADWTIRRDGNDVVTRAGLLGIPAAVLGEARPNLAIVRRVGPQAGRPLAGLLVADLSSMWAGPLAARVLARAGATVVKVETASRPDGTRSGNREFFDWINSGKLSYVVDDIGDVRPLLAAADVVITSSRASALAQRGIGSAAADARPGRVWLRITGYGAEGDHANRVAFGDDAAVAGGLVGTSSDGPVFCGDAIADPLTGLTAALAVIESVHRGGGELIDVSMAAVAATYAALPLAPAAAKCPASPPSPMSPCAPAADLGTDNARVNELIFERSCATC